MNNLGMVALVGAGPGEFGLLTVKGKELLKRAECIVYDRLLNKDLLKLAPSSCEMIFVGKANHCHTVSQDRINEILFEKAKEYSLVVRLKGGDPYVFGRGGEEALYLLERNVNVEVVPGISSSIAALSSAGIPITHRGLAKGFQVITAHSKKDELAEIDYTQLLDEDITYVFLMGLAHVKDIAASLIDAGRDKDTPIAVISKGTTNDQRKVVGTLETIGEKLDKAGLESPSIIVVGKVVTLSNNLNFFEKRPLFGKSYFIPSIESFDYHISKTENKSLGNELEQYLRSLGAKVVSITSGIIKPIKINLEFLKDLKEDDYLVFTSSNGVRAFFWNLYELSGYDARSIGRCKIAAIGEKTVAALLEFGIKADVVSKAQNGADLASTLNKDVENDSILWWLCSNKTSEGFENHLSANVRLEKIVCYSNEEVNVEDAKALNNEIRGCDAAIFTSGTNAKFAAKNFRDILPAEILSIGPTCSMQIEKEGLVVSKEAKKASYRGIMEII